MFQRRILFALASIALVLVLSYFKALQIAGVTLPDTYTYLRAALLWPQGRGMFLASFVGDRHLAVSYYRLFLDMLGVSLDSLSLALANLYALTGMMVVALAFLLMQRPGFAFLLAAMTNIVMFGSQLFFFTLTEPVFIASNTLLVLVWVLALRYKHLRWVLLCLASAAAGFFSYIRQGTVLFVVGMLLTLGAAWVLERRLVPKTQPNRLKMIVVAILATTVLLSAYALGASAGAAAWRLWIPFEKPPSQRFVFAMNRAVTKYVGCDNGPASHLACELAGMAPNDPRVGGHVWSVWVLNTLRTSYDLLGPSATDRLMRDVALESIARQPLQVVGEAILNFGRYFLEPLPTVAFLGQNYDEQRQVTADHIMDWDRTATQSLWTAGERPQLGVLLAARLPILTEFRRVSPPIRMLIILPGLVISGMLVSETVLFARRRQTLWMAFLPFCFYVVISMGIAAFAQGFGGRFSEPFRLLGIFVIGATLLDFVMERRQGVSLRSANQADALPRVS